MVATKLNVRVCPEDLREFYSSPRYNDYRPISSALERILKSEFGKNFFVNTQFYIVSIYLNDNRDKILYYATLPEEVIMKIFDKSVYKRYVVPFSFELILSEVLI